MSDFVALSRRLTDAIALTVPPVAVVFHKEAPSSVASPDAPVPAGCKFWEIGSTRSVMTSAMDHRHCSVGIYTHNVDGAPDSQSSELEETLAAMTGLGYVRPEEVASLPVLDEAWRHVQYGPLAEMSARPALVLLFANASQGLVLSEALARVDGATPPAMGRPACALIPQIRKSGRAAASLGCCGARAYLDVMSDEVTLWGLPGEKLESYLDEIEILAKANSVLGVFHRRRREDIEAGSTPTVKESLSRL